MKITGGCHKYLARATAAVSQANLGRQFELVWGTLRRRRRRRRLHDRRMPLARSGWRGRSQNSDTGMAKLAGVRSIWAIFSSGSQLISGQLI